MLKISDVGLRKYRNQYKTIVMKKLLFPKGYLNGLKKLRTEDLIVFYNNEVDKFISCKIDAENHINKFKNFHESLIKKCDSLKKEYGEKYRLCEHLYKLTGYIKNEDLNNIKEKYSNCETINYKTIKSKESRLNYIKSIDVNLIDLIEDSKLLEELKEDTKVSIEFIESINKLGNKYVKAYIIDNFQSLIIGDESYDSNYYKQLKNHIREINKKVRKYVKEIKDAFGIKIDEKEKINEILKKINEDKKILKSIFDYKKLIYDDGLRDKLLNKVGSNVCPYCGRQFISGYMKDNKEKNSADLDHFFNKDNYPYLTLSLFNFVPACQICNSRLKHEKDFYTKEHLYPYSESMDDYDIFDINEKDLIVDIINGEVEPEIVLAEKLPEKIKNNIKTFCLESMYQNHKKDVVELFKNIQIYSPEYLADIYTQFYNEDSNQKEREISSKAIEVMMNLFRDKDSDEILSKLHNDLLKKYWKDGK